MAKLTEDEIVYGVIKSLENEGWTVKSYCIGRQKGCDIVAYKGEQKLIVEAKGARANDEAPTKKREQFDCGQVKNHLGDAIVKVITEMHKNPDFEFMIAHPDDVDIKRWIGHLIPYVKKLGVKHCWVDKEGILTYS